MPMYSEIVYDWPHSQNCMDCANSIFLDANEDLDYIFPAYFCSAKCEENDGSNCPQKEILEDIEGDE